MEHPEPIFPIIGLIYDIKRAKMLCRHFIGNMSFIQKNIFLLYYHLFRSDRPDGFGGMAIATHYSTQVRPIKVCDTLYNDLVSHSLDLVGIVVFSNSFQSIQILSTYISPSFNSPDVIKHDVFS